MQCSGWKETITPSPMPEDYEVQTEMLSGTARLTPRMPRSPNVTIWFCSWSITRHKATLCKSDGQGFIRTSWQRCRQKGLRVADHAQNKDMFSNDRGSVPYTARGSKLPEVFGE